MQLSIPAATMNENANAVRRRQTALTFGVLWVLTIVYITLFPTRHYTPDAINYLPPIENHNVFELWHTQHLLGLWPGYLLYSFANGALRAWQAMRIAQAFLGGLTVALVYLTIWRLTHAARIAIIGSLVLWFSYGFWHFQSDPDIYSIGYVGVALLICLYVNYLMTPNLPQIVLLTVVAGFAILSHQMNLELAGLIGLSLLWSGWHSRRYGHVFLYGVECALLVTGFYFIGWLNVAPLLASGTNPPTGLQWALRYFSLAQSGQVTWGVSLHLANLPTAAYGVLSSWVLVAPLGSISTLNIVLLGLLLVGLTIVLLHAPQFLIASSMPERLVASLCFLTIIANGVSGWWWQAGNIKFDLFMQIAIIVLVSLYLKQAVNSKRRRSQLVSFTGVGLVIFSLVTTQVFLTLPFETQGGVFAVRDLESVMTLDQRPTAVLFQDNDQANAYNLIRLPTDPPATVLGSNFCQGAPPASHTWWVISEKTSASCAALTNTERVSSYQADRSRQHWFIFTPSQTS